MCLGSSSMIFFMNVYLILCYNEHKEYSRLLKTSLGNKFSFHDYAGLKSIPYLATFVYARRLPTVVAGLKHAIDLVTPMSAPPRTPPGRTRLNVHACACLPPPRDGWRGAHQFTLPDTVPSAPLSTS